MFSPKTRNQSLYIIQSHSQNGSTNDETNRKIQGIETEQMLNYHLILKTVTNILEKPASYFFRLLVTVQLSLMFDSIIMEFIF